MEDINLNPKHPEDQNKKEISPKKDPRKIDREKEVFEKNHHRGQIPEDQR